MGLSDVLALTINDENASDDDRLVTLIQPYGGGMFKFLHKGNKYIWSLKRESLFKGVLDNDKGSYLMVDLSNYPVIESHINKIKAYESWVLKNFSF